MKGEKELWVNTEGKTAVSKLLYPGEAPSWEGLMNIRSEERRPGSAGVLFLLLEFISVTVDKFLTNEEYSATL